MNRKLEINGTRLSKAGEENRMNGKTEKACVSASRGGSKMKRYIFLALGLLVLLPGLVFAQRRGSTKVIQKNSPGVQTVIVQTSFRGNVEADTVNLPDTVYANMPFTGSIRAEKVGSVEIEGKKYEAKDGLLQVASVFAAYGDMAVNFLDKDGNKIGSTTVMVAKAPDSYTTRYEEIAQTGTNYTVRDSEIDGIGGNTGATLGGDSLGTVTEVPGKSILKIREGSKTGESSLHFKDGDRDTSVVVTEVDAKIKGPEKMDPYQAGNFLLQVGGLERWNFEENPLNVDIRSEGSVRVGASGVISQAIEGVNASGIAEIPFVGYSGEPGPYHITATVAQEGKKECKCDCELVIRRVVRLTEGGITRKEVGDILEVEQGQTYEFVAEAKLGKCENGEGRFVSATFAWTYVGPVGTAIAPAAGPTTTLTYNRTGLTAGGTLTVTATVLYDCDGDRKQTTCSREIPIEEQEVGGQNCTCKLKPISIDGPNPGKMGFKKEGGKTFVEFHDHTFKAIREGHCSGNCTESGKCREEYKYKWTVNSLINATRVGPLDKNFITIRATRTPVYYDLSLEVTLNCICGGDKTHPVRIDCSNTRKARKSNTFDVAGLPEAQLKLHR